MTALGKTLTVFVFLLSLAWCWLTVNAFVTRTNWQTQTNTWKQHAETAAARARDFEAELNKIKDANKTQVAELMKTITSQKDQLTSREIAMTELNGKFDQLSLDNMKAENARKETIKNLEATNNQLTSAKSARDAIEGRFVTAQRSEQEAKNFALAMKLEADAFKARNEQLELQTLQLLGQMNDMRQGRTGIGSGQIVPVPADLRASVTSVTGDLITITLGADAGLMKGAVLDVSRFNPTKYLGQIRISDVEPKRAIGVFIPAGGGRMTADNAPRAGDTVNKIP